MFDFDASKLLIIGVVALIVIGPKDLPRVLRQVGQMVGKLRRMAGEFQGQFMDAMKEADLQDLRDEVNKLKDTASLDTAFDPVHDVRSELTKAVGSASPPLAPAVADPAAELPAPDLPAGEMTGVALPGPSGSPAAVGAVPALEQGRVILDSVEPAHHTPAVSAGAVHAVEAAEPDAAEAVRRRRVVVPKRRPPGDRSAVPALAGRGRSILPPRREPRA